MPRPMTENEKMRGWIEMPCGKHAYVAMLAAAREAAPEPGASIRNSGGHVVLAAVERAAKETP